MSPKLVVEVCRVDNHILFRVVEQDESFRGLGTLMNCGRDSVISGGRYGSPCIHRDADYGNVCVYIRGDETGKDKTITVSRFASEKQASSVLVKVAKVIRKFNTTESSTIVNVVKTQIGSGMLYHIESPQLEIELIQHGSLVSMKVLNIFDTGFDTRNYKNVSSKDIIICCDYVSCFDGRNVAMSTIDKLKKVEYINFGNIKDAQNFIEKIIKVLQKVNETPTVATSFPNKTWITLQ